MCINFTLLHKIFQPFLLKKGLFLLLLSLFEFLIKLFPLSFAVSDLLIPLPPVVTHFFRQLPRPHDAFLSQSLSSYSAFSNFLKAILAYLFIIIFLITFILLIHSKGLGKVFLHNCLPGPLQIDRLLLLLGLYGCGLDLLALLKDLMHVIFIQRLLFWIIRNEVRIELQWNNLSAIYSLKLHMRRQRVHYLLTGDGWLRLQVCEAGDNVVEWLEGVREFRHFVNFYFVFWYFFKKFMRFKSDYFYQFVSALLSYRLGVSILVGCWILKKLILQVLNRACLLRQSSNFSEQFLNSIFTQRSVRNLFSIILILTSYTAIVQQKILHIKSISTHGLHVNLSDRPLEALPLHPFLKAKDALDTVNFVLELPLTQESAGFLPLDGNLGLTFPLIFHGILESLVPS